MNPITEMQPVFKPLLYVKEKAYDLVFEFNNFKPETESTEYGACTFTLNGHRIIFRIAKTTPTKSGQFVTLWKRNKQGITAPFETTDDFDFIIISTTNGTLSGQFVFPKTALLGKGIISANNKGGKRAIRVYSPWDKAESKQASETKQWQSVYFMEITDKKLSSDYIASFFKKNPSILKAF